MDARGARTSEYGEDTHVCDELNDAYNEWRRHISARLDAEPDAYSSAPVTLLLGRADMHVDVQRRVILMAAR